MPLPPETSQPYLIELRWNLQLSRLSNQIIADKWNIWNIHLDIGRYKKGCLFSLVAPQKCNYSSFQMFGFRKILPNPKSTDHCNYHIAIC